MVIIGSELYWVQLQKTSICIKTGIEMCVTEFFYLHSFSVTFSFLMYYNKLFCKCILVKCLANLIFCLACTELGPRREKR